MTVWLWKVLCGSVCGACVVSVHSCKLRQLICQYLGLSEQHCCGVDGWRVGVVSAPLCCDKVALAQRMNVEAMSGTQPTTEYPNFNNRAGQEKPNDQASQAIMPLTHDQRRSAVHAHTLQKNCCHTCLPALLPADW